MGNKNKTPILASFKNIGKATLGFLPLGNIF